MQRTKSFRWLGTVGLILSVSLLAACSSENSSTFQDKIVTKENSAQLAEQARTELSYENYELLQGFVKRVYPDQPQGTLPVGMPVKTMIESQKAYLEAQAARTGEPQPTGAAAGAEDLAPSPANAATTEEPAPTRPPAAKSVKNRPAPGPEKPQPAGTASTPSESAQAATPSGQSAPEQSEPPLAEPVEQASGSAPTAPAPAAPPPPPAPRSEIVPAGETLTIRLDQALSSKTNQAGQKFEGTLDADLRVNDTLVAPAGSRVIGRITEAVPSGKVKGKAKMALELTGLEVAGNVYDISTRTLAFEAQGTGKEDAKKVGIASGIGAIIGAIAGGGKGAAIGATIGAGAGTGVVLATPGDEVEFPNEQRMVFKLDQSVELPAL